MCTEAKLAGIARHSAPFADVEEIDRAVIAAASGIEGDYRGTHAEPDRQVIVVFAEQWRAVCEDVGEVLPWTSRRANLYVAGVENPRRPGVRIHVGAAELEVTGECEPCSRMDRRRDGLRAALTPAWRGGVACRVVRGGGIEVGQRIEVSTVDRPLPSPADVIRFWFESTPPEKRFTRDAGLDREISHRFGAARDRAFHGVHDDWANAADGALALLILLDQFSRNLFRSDRRAFAADGKAIGIAHRAIEAGLDAAQPVERRPYFYLPFMHSEELADQDRCVELFRSHLPSDHPGQFHAEQHRELIRRFGRFPYRNEALRASEYGRGGGVSRGRRLPALKGPSSPLPKRNDRD